MISRKSFVLSASFPESKVSVEGFAAALKAIDPYGVAVVEYFCEGISPEQVRRMLGGRAGFFLPGAKQKQAGLSLCTADKAARLFAVEKMREYVRFAKDAGNEAVLFTSGDRPPKKEDDELCVELLRDSLLRISAAVPEMLLLLEPGDRDVQYRQLIGTTKSAVEFARSLRGKAPLELTFDMSHAAQTGEDVYAAWELAREHCRHVHLANCVLDKSLPLYGDRHPLFGVTGGMYSQDDALAFYRFLAEQPQRLTVGVEMIPADAEPPGFLERIVKNVPWFFKEQRII